MLLIYAFYIFNNLQKPIRSIQQCPIDTEGHAYRRLRNAVCFCADFCLTLQFLFSTVTIYNISNFPTSILRFADKVPGADGHRERREINNRTARNRGKGDAGASSVARA